MIRPDHPVELDALLSTLLDGSLATADAARLEAIAAADPTAMTRLLDLLDLQSTLAWKNRSFPFTPAADSPALKPDLSPPRAKVRVPGVRHRHASLQRGMVYASAAAILLAAAVAIYLFAFNPKPETRDPQPDQPIATVTDATGVVWSSEPLIAGQEIGPRTIRIDGGRVELVLASGAMINLIGPAELGLNTAMGVKLARGIASFACPREAIGFVVDSPHLRVVDLGTEFSLRVDNRDSDLHVIDGAVRFTPTGGVAQELTAGMAAHVGSDRGVRVVAVDPIEAGASRLVATTANRTMRRGWRWLGKSATGAISTAGQISTPSGKLVILTYEGSDLRRQSPATWTDVRAEAMIRCESEAEAGGFVGVLLRVQPNATASEGFYMARIVEAGALQLSRGLDLLAAPVTLARPYEPGETWRLIFEAVGPDLQARVVDSEGRLMADARAADATYTHHTAGLRMSRNWLVPRFSVYSLHTRP